MGSLKEVPAWDNTSEKNDITAKTQAIKLLFADFLMNQNNLFTLQEFVMEVPLLSHIYEVSSYINRSEVKGPVPKKQVNYDRFCLNDIQDILEVLGIQPNSDEMELTCQYYFSKRDNQLHSLLACLFEAISTVKNNLSKDDEIQISKECQDKSAIDSNTHEHRLNYWLLSVEDILKSFNLDEKQKNILKKLLEKCPQDNIVKDVAVNKEHLKELKVQNTELLKKNSDLEQMIATYFDSNGTNLLFQKTQQVRLEQQKLCQLENTLVEKENSLQERLKDVENQKYELDRREIDILRCEKKLREELTDHNDRTKTVNQVNQLLQGQNVNLEKQLLEIKLKLNELKDHKKNDHTSPSLDKEIVKKLLRENDELREFIKDQQQKIEELSIKASNLAKQIEKTHQVFPKTADHQTKNVKKKLYFIDDTYKKHCYTHKQNISSTTTDHSTTMLESDNQTEDDMVKEARSRYKMLEKKTEKMEQNFKDFAMDLMQYHSSDYKAIKVARKPYNDVRSNFSDDSDLGKNNETKINLKELANKIGYHRSVRRSRNASLSEIDTSPEYSNTQFQNFPTNVTNIIPLKILSSKVKEMYKESNKPVSKTESPLSRVLFQNEYPSNAYTRIPIENQSQLESTVINENILNANSPNLINPEICAQSKNNSKIQIDSGSQMDVIEHFTPPKKSDDNIERHKENSDKHQNSNINHNPSTGVRQNNSTRVDTSSSSKIENDHTVSFGSVRTDKSSDFWA